MLKRISKLIDVKSIVTFAVTGAFIYLSIIQAIKPDQFLAIFTMIISFYFGTQSGKKEKELEKLIEEEEDKNG